MSRMNTYRKVVEDELADGNLRAVDQEWQKKDEAVGC